MMNTNNTMTPAGSQLSDAIETIAFPLRSPYHDPTQTLYPNPFEYRERL